MTVRLEHVAVWTNDLERLRAFYERYFGVRADVEAITREMRADGVRIVSPPRQTGDGYCRRGALRRWIRW